ncbi:MAG: tRNA (adenine(22)-N(1))-methyltransferase TrmK [Mycoplasmataceae bacterium]|jgi:tRNA (adenine22-N1)-methyltransferase|nr:tRNA (adenine(22)-N(1))-methyltransferase TrmK [Mycoplasmataceae bacterium]
MKLSNRLLAIATRISKKDNVIVDVGCDHCYTSINALLNCNTKFAFNIDVANAPLQSGVKNIEKYKLINKTKNIVSNGLKTKEIDKKIDYCIISGLGGNTIVEILENSSVKNINEYILVANDHPEVIRKYINDNKLKISYEEIIKERGFFFHLIQISPKGLSVKTEQDILFGPYILTHRNDNFNEYLQFLLTKYKKVMNTGIKKFDKQIELINNLI